jgi:hypothetical protein
MVLFAVYTFLLSLMQLVKRHPQEIRISLYGLNRFSITVVYSENESKELIVYPTVCIHTRDDRTMAEIIANKIDQLN